jgi:hypothetical protein
MSSIKCPHCSLTNWSSDETCKRCKQPLHVAPQQQFETYTPAPQYQPQYQQSYSTAPLYQPQPYGYQSQQNLKTGLALASMILGIVSLPTSFFLLGLLLAPIGFVLGIVSVVKANKQPNVFGGKGFAIAGIATSAFTFFLIVPIIAAIAIPNLLAARRSANEFAALKTVNTLYAAEVTYQATTGQGKCGDMNNLVAASLISAEMAKSERNGYKFKVEMNAPYDCEIHAAPLSTSTGTRSFMISTSDDTLRAGDKKGAFASYTDLPMQYDEPVFSEKSRRY